jgi:hypothetical protein
LNVVVVQTIRAVILLLSLATMSEHNPNNMFLTVINLRVTYRLLNSDHTCCAHLQVTGLNDVDGINGR